VDALTYLNALEARDSKQLLLLGSFPSQQVNKSSKVACFSLICTCILTTNFLETNRLVAEMYLLKRILHYSPGRPMYFGL
jgi:hypothetical protein